MKEDKLTTKSNDDIPITRNPTSKLPQMKQCTVSPKRIAHIQLGTIPSIRSFVAQIDATPGLAISNTSLYITTVKKVK
jgi:hypothetical protein